MTGIFACIVQSAVGQNATQMKRWFIPPFEVDVEFGSAPAATQITGMPITLSVANGYYDVNKNLLFYVDGSHVRDYNNTLIGTISPAVSGGEIVIVPFGDNDPAECKHKYNIFTTSGQGGGSGNVVLVQSILDLTAWSLGTANIADATLGVEFGAIAAGLPDANGDRHLYWMGGSGNWGQGNEMRHLIIDNNGSVALAPTPTLYPQTQFSGIGIELMSLELDISPDGEWLAWGSWTNNNPLNAPAYYPFRYYLIDLDPSNGNFISIQKFLAPGPTNGNFNNGFRGVEFFKDQPTGNMFLFVGAGSDGVYRFDLSTMTSAAINGTSPDYGYSQLEMANNTLIYAVSNTATGAAIGIAPLNLTLTGAFTINQPPPSVASFGSPPIPFYTLPDQLDGENYDNQITIPPIPSIYAHLASVGTATWSYGNNNNPWNFLSGPVRVHHDITIPAGANITIEGMQFIFSPNARINIMPGIPASSTAGGKLTVDKSLTQNSLLTSTPCKNIWQGVHVYGNSLYPQFLNNNPAIYQGTFIIKNQSVLERAWVGVTLSGPGANQTGGIVQATHAVFLNNWRDVSFLPYHNKNGSGKQVGNVSYFRNCDFIADNSYPTFTVGDHISINECEGISIIGGRFRNIQSSVVSNTTLGTGIRSLNGGFRVIAYCTAVPPQMPCPSAYLQGSLFENLDYAIYATRSIRPNKSIVVDKATFANNAFGIYASGINNITLIRNTFTIGDNLNLLTFPPSQIGIMLNACSGYTVEENGFTEGIPSSPVTIGSVISNSGNAENIIYKNRFQNLDYANLAIGKNRNPNLPHGLQYLCNEHISISEYDIFVTPSGVRLIQGDQALAAGNQFSVPPCPQAATHFNNLSGSLVDYYYHSAGANENPTCNAFVNPTSTNNANTCPTHFGGGSGSSLRLTAQQIAQLTALYDSAEAAYLPLLYNFNQFIDGGNTNALLTEIQLNWAQDAYQLRDQLIAHSPYLSEEVLREVALMNVLPAAMMLEVCLANPDATKSTDFLHFLQYEIPTPLPQYMINLIIASWDGSTARTALQSSLAHYSYLMASASDGLLADLYYRDFFEPDSIPNDTIDVEETIRYWLNRVQTLSAKYDLTENYFHNEMIQEAVNTRDSIPVNFNLEEMEITHHDDYLYLYNFRGAVLNDNRTLLQLTSSEITALQEFANPGNSLARIWAQNLLCFAYNICWETVPEIPGGGGGKMMYQNYNEWTPKQVSSVKVKPNPVSDYAVFEIAYYPSSPEAKLAITDLEGRPVARFNVDRENSQITWDVKQVAKGLYFYSLYDGKKLVAKGKMSVEK